MARLLYEGPEGEREVLLEPSVSWQIFNLLLRTSGDFVKPLALLYIKAFLGTISPFWGAS